MASTNSNTSASLADEPYYVVMPRVSDNYSNGPSRLEKRTVDLVLTRSEWEQIESMAKKHSTGTVGTVIQGAASAWWGHCREVAEKAAKHNNEPRHLGWQNRDTCRCQDCYREQHIEAPRALTGD